MCFEEELEVNENEVFAGKTLGEPDVTGQYNVRAP